MFSQLPLIYHEIIHFSLSTITALLVYYFSRNCAVLSTFREKTSLPFWKLWLAALISGFFIDVDHIFDHFFAYGIKGFFEHGFLSIFDASIANPFAETEKVYVLFHAWEWFLVGLSILYLGVKRCKRGKGKVTRFITSEIIAVWASLLLSYSFHLIFDSLSWLHSPWGYFLLYRLNNHFSLLSF